MFLYKYFLFAIIHIKNIQECINKKKTKKSILFFSLQIYLRIRTEMKKTTTKNTFKDSQY